MALSDVSLRRKAMSDLVAAADIGGAGEIGTQSRRGLDWLYERRVVLICL
jgi:hypothetical protein